MRMRYDTRLPLCIAVSGLAAALLAACGGSAGLIPTGNAGPLRSDFEAVANAAENGNGDCSSTRTAIQKTEGDFESLPSSVDARLRTRLSEGIAHLRSQALLACTQPSGAGTSTTATASSPASSSSTPTSTSTSTSTLTSTSTSTSTTSSAPSGGTPAEEGEAEEPNPGGVGPKGEGPPGHLEHGGAVP
jgi:hypothetical protein